MLGGFVDCVISVYGFLLGDFLGRLGIVVLPVFVVRLLHFDLLHVQV